MTTMTTPTIRPGAWAIAAAVPDPVHQLVTIGERGIVHDVTEDDQGRVHVQITSTDSGWPVMEAIRTELIDTLTCAGYQHVDVEFVVSPSAWSAD